MLLEHQQDGWWDRERRRAERSAEPLHEVKLSTRLAALGHPSKHGANIDVERSRPPSLRCLEHRQ